MKTQLQCATARKESSRETRSMTQHSPDDGRNPPPRDLVTAVTGVPLPVPAPASVSCLFPTATNRRPVLMDRLPDRPDDPPPSDYKLDRRGYAYLLEGVRLAKPQHWTKGGMIVGTVMNVGLNIGQVVAACSLSEHSLVIVTMLARDLRLSRWTTAEMHHYFRILIYPKEQILTRVSDTNIVSGDIVDCKNDIVDAWRMYLSRLDQNQTS